MAETFDFDVQVGASGDVKQRTWSNDFGDGYTQAGGVGINTKSQAWDVTVTGRFGVGQKLQQVQDFLDRHEGFKSFLWTPPGSGTGRYTANGYKLSTLGNGLHSLTTNFKQTFKP
ncbi:MULTISPECIES: phage tail protein [Pseudomonas syringae group]|uniref:Phage minor tail protein n=1 Tax=Pseudomonas syringae pv. maculicola TaxID=59511 RepID=A0A3M6CJJ5_PSEYM|nr:MULTISPECIES: phage tail protein [Pseudomonas syringae group]KPY63674.1 Phage minor tail protein [Pseudomonas amygdali pv. sesami]RMT98377.1 Phage minor tail protein [Pseudomonas amygdali pv. sesami]RMV43544.1 Phage minor tail protein [Pseudomonas syringae pv. maculicola]